MKKYELTAPQKNIYGLQRFYSNTSISVLCGAVIFSDMPDCDILIQSVKQLIKRHEALRLRFITEKGKPLQYVSPDYEDEISFMEFNSHEEMRKYCIGQADTPFSADGSPMCSFTVFCTENKTGIILRASHLIADAWTYSILAEDVSYIYHKLKNGEMPDENIYRFTDTIGKYTKYISSEKYKADLEWWSEKYSGGIEPTCVRSCRRESSCAAERYISSLSPSLSASADKFCTDNGFSSAVLFETAVLIYLSHINRENSTVTINVPVLGRSGAYEKCTAGMFISHIPLTLSVNTKETAISMCRRVSDAHREIFRHRKLPYEAIISGIRKQNDLSGRLSDVMVSCQNAQTNISARTEWFSNGCSELPLAIHTDNRDSRDRYTITVDYQTDFFPDSREIRLLTERIKHIIGQIINGHGEISVKSISPLPQSEYDMLIHDFNRTDTPYDRDKTVQTAFSEIAEKHPDKTALVFRGRKYSYSKLDKMSSAVAGFLYNKGIGRGNIVPVISRRSPYMLIAMLGILKSGAAYMPISPDFPRERTEYMINSVNASVVLTCGYEIKNGTALESIDYTYTEHTYEKGSPDDTCYIIFTSGSSGKPKGTAITHRNVLNYCAYNKLNVAGGILTEDIKSIVSVTDFVFDIFVTESILSLLNGIVIYLADDEQAFSQIPFGRLVSESKAHVLQTTPSKLRSLMLDKKKLDFLYSFKIIILGGEELPPLLCTELKRYTSAKLYNIYGPAETTVWSAFAPADEKDMTIGRPVANTHIYILDENMSPVPVGVKGEICISGDGVGKGYIDNAALTEEKFLPDPFFKGNMMYRTGDMGLICCDGNIEFHGRKDNQIKLRGLRIELGETENIMNSFDGMGLSAVVCRTDSRGEQYLAGFYTSTVPVDEKALRRYLSEKLPTYMIPKVFMRLSDMPMTKSGKLDRKSLPRCSAAAISSDNSCTAPTDKTEKLLCSLISEVLSLSRVSMDDNFFELGGDSFSALELSALAEENGLSLSPQSIYENPTVKQLCSSVSDNTPLKKTYTAYGRYPMKRTHGDIRLFELFAYLSDRLYDISISGLDFLDSSEKYILCPNHASDLDCMWVLSALRTRAELKDTCALIASEHLEKPLSRHIFRISGGIPIERKGDFMPALKRAVYILKKEKRFLLIHPEGTRTRTGKTGPFRKGAGIISKKTGIKAVPVYIGGSGRIYPVTRQFPKLFDIYNMKKYPLRISFGTPVDPFDKTPSEITEELRRQIIKMKKIR
ncbi:MAG: amino acid adenylation domain-containing protein [Oscillospiraceae bacterium]|nr:amino acid adenylation domain-containing protein [Oscillospiraceae bacterium]